MTETKKVDHVHGSAGEAVTRAALEELFPGKRFLKTRRLSWLSPLELDGYNEELNLGFEYHGVQHFKEIPFFHRTPDAFEQQQERDARKQELCDDHLSGFVVVTYETPLVDIRRLVRSQVEDMCYLVPLGESKMTDTEFIEHTIKNSEHCKVMLEKVRMIAHDKGGECLSTVYIDSFTLMKFKCGVGHIFEQSLQGIDHPAHKGPRFCTICGGTKKQTVDENQRQGRKYGLHLHRNA
ncbi:MAG: hypothetical protein KGL39_40765 [Patescibacteria group bacterium]|nr:hypothetical protein [Patescibacteria group bacterium]